MIFDRFDQIRIINLPHRTDRRREMERELARVGLDNDRRVQFFPARSAETEGMFYSKGAHGCFLSHRAVIDEAAASGASLLLLEDDCNFTTAVFSNDVPDFDFLWGGVLQASDWNDLENSDLIGAHFIGMNAATIQKASSYLRGYLEPEFEPDPRAAAEPGFDPDKRPVSDGAYVWFRRAHPEVRTVFAEYGEQRPSRTDVGQSKWFDRVPVAREMASLLRQMRQMART